VIFWFEWPYFDGLCVLQVEVFEWLNIVVQGY
jgi:hypothetical protein